jgi:hypothetical protein
LICKICVFTPNLQIFSMMFFLCFVGFIVMCGGLNTSYFLLLIMDRKSCIMILDCTTFLTLKFWRR